MPPKDIYSQRVREVMAVHVVAVNPSDSINEALQLMVENRVSALPVVDGHERCVGVISSTDLLQLAQELGGELEALHTTEGLAHALLVEKLEHSGFADQTVQELMTPTAVEIEPEATLVAAAASMVRNRVHHLAVTEQKHKLVGIISTMDVLRAVAESGQ
jgi:CBS domain-containing protein